MKNLLYVLGIIVLLFFIMFPPILRIVLPDKDKIKEDDVKELVVTILNCSNEKYITTTTYENAKITRISIKKNNLEEEENSEDNADLVDEESNEDTESKTIMDDIFDNLIKQNGVFQTNQESGTILTLDFSVSDIPGIDLSNIGKKIDDQKAFYESDNLVCSIIK